MRKYILRSGKKIEFNLSSIENALSLFRTFTSELSRSKLTLPTDELTFGELLEKNQSIIFNILSSEHVTECIKACCDKVLYDGQRFSMDLFEDEENRQDFFGLMTLIGVENIRPFFPDLEIAYEMLLSIVLKK